VGRASNRKKAQRQVGPKTRVDAETQQALLQMVAGLEAMTQEMGGHTEREAAARRIWSGGAEPVLAEAPQWAENSLGDRFFGGTFIDRVRNAPSLATAEIPDAAVIAADPAHWNVATDALIRAVVYDGLGLDHPAVRTLLEVLAPIAAAELAYGEAADADALIGAFAKHYRCELPGDAELLERIGKVQGDALVNLVRADAVKPADVLPVGLRLLSALAHLCRSDSASLLQRVA